MSASGQSTRAAEQFGATAANYAVSRAHSAGESLEQVAAFAAKGGRRYALAVDIATGAGFTAFEAAPHADRVVATDLTRPMLEQTRRLSRERDLGRVELAMALAESLPFADGAVSLLTCRTAPHHFADVRRWLGETARVLEPGGVFVLCDTVAPEDVEIAAWMNEVELERDPSHGRNWPPSEWERAVADAGLRVTDTALCKVWHEGRDWTARSNMAPADAERVQARVRDASPAIRQAFGVEQDAAGALTWYWDVLVLRAEKAG